MGGEVSSWFVPQNLLDMVPKDQAQVAADQARNTFMWGLLSGDVGSAFNNAQTQGYNTLLHGVTLAEKQKTLADEAVAQNILRNSMGVAPGTGVGTADPRYAPRDVNGAELQGPGYVPPVPQLNWGKVMANPNAPLVAKQLRDAQAIFAPEYGEFQGQIYNKRDPNLGGVTLRNMQNINGALIDSNAVPSGFTVPKVNENQELQFVPGKGWVTAPVKGAAQSVATLEGAKANAQEAAKAAYDVPAGGVYDAATGNTVAQTRLQQVKAANSGNAPILKPSAAVAAANDAYKPILENAYSGYKLATDRAPNLQTLRSFAEKLDTNSFTPAKMQIIGALRAAGLTGADAEKTVNNYAAYTTLLNNQAAQNIQDLTGPKSNFDIQFTKERMANATNPRDANLFNLDFMMAADRLKQEKYKFIQQNPSPNAELDWQASEKNRSIYEDPALRKYLPKQTVQSGEHKGATAYQLPSGEWKVYK